MVAEPLALTVRPPDLARATSWSVVVDAFLASAVDSENTRRAYRRHLRRAFAYLGVTAVAELAGAHLAGYRAAVVTSGLAPASQGQVLAAVRSFLSWSRTMGAHGLSSDVVAAALRTPRATVRRPYQVLSEPEVGAVLQVASGPRDRGLLAVLLGAGLRVSEVSGLDITDLVIDHEGGAALYVRQGKGRKDRMVPIHQEVTAVVRAYLHATGRRLGEDGPLFRAHDRAARKLPRGRLTARAIADVVARHVQAAGITAKHCSPHTMRHSYAIRALRNGGSIVAVSKLLGHANIATTSRYLDHLELGELRAAVPHLPIDSAGIVDNSASQKPGTASAA
jgi:site-specific recombinase XerD